MDEASRSAAQGFVELRSSGAAADVEDEDVAGSRDPKAFHEQDGGALIRADIASLDARPEALWVPRRTGRRGQRDAVMKVTMGDGKRWFECDGGWRCGRLVP